MSEALIPLPLSSSALAVAAASTLRGLPPWRLLAAAAASPALVRSVIVSRSSCANAAIIVSMAAPMGPVLSNPSVSDRKPAPRSPDLLDDVQDVPSVASQTIELPHGGYVTGLQPVQGVGELRAFHRGRADAAAVGKDPRSAGGLECSDLQIKVLFCVGNSRVRDHSHWPSPHYLNPEQFVVVRICVVGRHFETAQIRVAWRTREAPTQSLPIVSLIDRL